MKKYIAILMFISTLILTACDEGETPSLPPVEKPNVCEHQYKEEYHPSTCNEYGYTIFKCVNCGDEYQKQETTLLDHEFGDWNHTDGDCESGSQDYRDCNNCGYREVIDIEPIGHKYNSIDSKEPSCLSDGYIEYECENCHHIYKETIKSSGHQYGPWEIVTNASCKNPGLKIKKCYCGDSVEEIIPAGDHDFINGECSACGVVSYLTFILNSNTNTYYVSGFDDSVSVVSIPEKYKDVLVTGISDEAFMGSTKLEEIYMSDNITDIGNNVFRGCSNLVKVKLSNNIDKISDNCFYECYQLSEINIPDKITYIGMNAFLYCGNLKSINIPNTVTHIDSYVFMGCISLVELSIPSSVEYIGKNILAECSNLSMLTIPFVGPKANNTDTYYLGYLFSEYEFNNSLSVKPDRYNSYKYYIPNGLTTINIDGNVGDKAFTNVTSIKNININGDIGNSAFSNATGLESVNITNVSKIGGSAFNGCSNLKNLNVSSDYCVMIGGSAFANCKGLVNVDFDFVIDTISEQAFYNCSNLTNLKLTSVKYLKAEAFRECVNLETIVIGDDLISFESGVFYNCSNVKYLTVPFVSLDVDDASNTEFYNIFGSYTYVPHLLELNITNDKNIKDYALVSFYNVDKITISDKTETIGYGAFNSNQTLTEVVLPNTITSIGSGAFSNCGVLSKINIPTSLTVIDGLFSNCYSLTDVVIPEGVLVIGGFNNTGITSIKLPSTLKEIKNFAFEGSKLSNIEIPNGVETIGISAFRETLISELIIPDSVSNIGENVIDGCRNLKRLTVPFLGESVDSKEGIEYFYDYNSSIEYLKVTKGNYCYIEESSSLKELEFLGLVKEVSLSVDLDKLTIGFDPGCSGLRYYYHVEQLNVVGKTIPSSGLEGLNCDKIIIDESVEVINDYAFRSSSVKEVEVLGLDVLINNAIFANCFNMKKLTIPNLGNSSINDLFEYSCSLDDLILTNIEVISEEMFKYANLNITILGDKLVEIKDYAFSDYSGSTIIIPSSVKKLGINVFANTSANIIFDNPTIEEFTIDTFNGYLGDLVVPSSVKLISEYAFNNYGGNIDFSNINELVIGEYALKNYYGDCITIPSSVKEIGYGAFSNYKGIINWDNPTIEVIKTGVFADFMGDTLVIPDSVVKIENKAITGARNLYSLTIPFIGESLDSEINYNFNFIIDDEYYSPHIVTINNGSVIKENAFINSKTKIFNLPDSLIKIEKYAFNHAELNEIVIPNSVKEIGYGAFNGCSFLNKLSVPFIGTGIDNKDVFVAILGDINTNYVYQYNNGYISGYVPEALKEITITGDSISDYAFFGLNKIEVINISKNVKTIGKEAFNYCESLTNINYFGSIDDWCGIYINSSPMEYATVFSCLNENNELYVPSDVYINTNINFNTFSYMNFSTVTIGSKVKEISRYAFKGFSGEILFDNATITKFDDLVFASYLGDSITIPSSVVMGSKELFKDYSGDIYFEDSNLETICSDMYRGYLGDNIVIPNGVINIEENAIYECINLLSITLPSSLVSINDKAIFSYKLVEVLNLGNVDLSNVSGLNSVNIIGDNTTLLVNDDYVFSYSNDEYKLVSYIGNESMIKLPEDINGRSYSIGDYAFDSLELYSVELTNGVTFVSSSAFVNCLRLVQIVNPNNLDILFTYPINELTSIKDDGLIFENDYVYIKDLEDNYYLVDYIGNNTNITLPSSFNEKFYNIHNYAFYKDTKLRSIYIPASIDKVGNYAFYGCSNLQRVNVGTGGINFIGSYAFAECPRLLEFSNLTEVASIGMFAFAGIKIDKLVLEGSYLVIPSYCFAYSGIKRLVIDGIMEIEDNAFTMSSCNIYYKSNEDHFNAAEKGNNTFENVYYYSEEEPNVADKYWHYDINEPVLW